VLVALPDGTAHSMNPQVLLNLQICKPSLTTPNVMIDQVTGEEMPASSDLSNMATVQTSNLSSTYAAVSNSQSSTVWVPEDEYLLPNSETGPWRRVSSVLTNNNPTYKGTEVLGRLGWGAHTLSQLLSPKKLDQNYIYLSPWTRGRKNSPYQNYQWNSGGDYGFTQSRVGNLEWTPYFLSLGTSYTPSGSQYKIARGSEFSIVYETYPETDTMAGYWERCRITTWWKKNNKWSNFVCVGYLSQNWNWKNQTSIARMITIAQVMPDVGHFGSFQQNYSFSLSLNFYNTLNNSGAVWWSADTNRVHRFQQYPNAPSQRWKTRDVVWPYNTGIDSESVTIDTRVKFNIVHDLFCFTINSTDDD
jgi:hypothetical protein